MNNDAVEARGVAKRFGDGPNEVTALDRVSVTIRHNEFFTLLGPSGCGKTTLLRLIAGFEQPSDGEILLYGEPISALPPYQRPVNTVFQSYALFPHLSVARNVAFAPEMRGVNAAETRALVDRMLKLVRLDGFADRLPRQLSGGQQQRVALARALAGQPKVLLLDEPLSALDLKLRKEMQLELKRLQHETGITFVFVTHDQEEALTMSDRIAVMNKGRILQLGSPTEIYDTPNTRFVANFIGETNLLDAVCVEREAGAGKYRLSCGSNIVLDGLDGHAQGAALTLVVRPERLEVVAADSPASVPVTVDNVVYMGSDTVCHLRLGEGTPVQARMQNRQGAARLLHPGDRAGLRIPPDSARVLVE